MAIDVNPFFKKASEDATDDQEFIHLFSPDVLERVSSDYFQGKVTIVRSPPGAGKTSLLRVLTPGVLKALCNSTHEDMRDTYHALAALGVVDARGPRYLTVNLSCASGYADLPPALGRSIVSGTFRALLNSRIIQRTLAAIAELLDLKDISRLSQVELAIPGTAEFVHIPIITNARELYDWAVRTERTIYADLDRLGPDTGTQKQMHFTFEAVRWLSVVTIRYKGKERTWQRMLTLDDVHKLRRSQRDLLFDELTAMRVPVSIWIAERTIALSAEEMFSQGVREGREYVELNLHSEWRDTKSKKVFADFVRSVVERRVRSDSVVRGSFESCLRDSLNEPEQSDSVIEAAHGLRQELITTLNDKARQRYQEWLAVTDAESAQEVAPLEQVIAWQKLAIRISRDQRKKQIALDLSPLNTEELDAGDSSGLRAAAERLATTRYGLPYYYGMDRLIQLAANNIEEFLGMAGQLYERLAAKHTLNLPTQISAADQDRIITEHAKRQFESIRRSHTHGDRAQSLLRAVGVFCRERTYEPNAPYQPGVTGVAITMQDLHALRLAAKEEKQSSYLELAQVIKECVAENLIDVRAGVRQGGTEWCILYLSRLMGVMFDLPPHYGGWQAVRLGQLHLWMTSGYPGRKLASDLL